MKLLTDILICTLMVICCNYSLSNAGSRQKRATVQPRTCPWQAWADSTYQKVITADAPQSLKDHSQEFVKQRIEVVPGIHFFIGYGLSNVIVVEAPDGLVVIDTLDSQTAVQPVIERIRAEVSNATFRAIIYTHDHPDHVGGALAFVKSQAEAIEVWGQELIIEEFWSKWQYNRPLMITRGFRQVGADLPDGALINAGLGPRFVLDAQAGLLLVPPTNFLTESQKTVNIAGKNFTLVYIPGETTDQMGIYVDDAKAFIIGDDFYKTFPNLYAIRGTPPRPVQEWYQSIDKIRKFDIEYLLPCHTLPVVGASVIQKALTNYRDSIQYVHDQTTRMMNKGLHPDVIAQTLKLPPSLASDEFLQEHYGTVEWSVKTVFEARLGWFSGFPEDLFPLTPDDEAERWLELVTPTRLFLNAKNKLKSGNLKDIKWAIKASSVLWSQRFNRRFPEFMFDIFSVFKNMILQLRSDALIKLATLQTSSNARNYLLRWVLEENCKQKNEDSVFTDAGTVSILPAANLVRKLALLLKAEMVHNVPTTVYVLNFTDINSVFTLTLRNSVMEMEDTAADKYDVKISVALSDFRSVVLKANTLAAVNATVYPDMQAGVTFMSYLDDPKLTRF